jgi:DNA-binding NtrC family response regulator
MSSVLVVNHRPLEPQAIRRVLEKHGHLVREAATTAEALETIRSSPIDVVFVGTRGAGDRVALDLLSAITAHRPEVDVVFVSDAGSIPDAVDAIKRGACDYLTLPLEPHRLLAIVTRILPQPSAAVAEADHDDPAARIVARSPIMHQLLMNVAKLALSRSAVLVTGESGTGKELIARLLHCRGPRRRTPFVPVNCGAIPEALVESELFGHSKGAFTGAVGERTGLLASAEGGVVFLDEIGEMPLPMQVRLLRFLQDGEVRLVGRSAVRHVDVRVVAATNRSLEEEIARGRFREDLYYRIAVLRLHVPPLRERIEDIRLLAQAHLRRVTTRSRLAARGFTADVCDRLDAYHWPGNVRELHSVVERAAHTADGPLITEADLSDALRSLEIASPDAPTTPDPPERARLRAIMDQCRWNHRRAAARLGISRTTLWRRLRAQGLDSDRGRWNQSFHV